jgi:hypothetical protein
MAEFPDISNFLIVDKLLYKQEVQTQTDGEKQRCVN